MVSFHSQKHKLLQADGQSTVTTKPAIPAFLPHNSLHSHPTALVDFSHP